LLFIIVRNRVGQAARRRTPLPLRVLFKTRHPPCVFFFGRVSPVDRRVSSLIEPQGRTDVHGSHPASTKYLENEVPGACISGCVHYLRPERRKGWQSEDFHWHRFS
jgi:hypothetical protein